MRDDLQMSASAYGFALGTFYWAYFIFEVPSNISAVCRVLGYFLTARDVRS